VADASAGEASAAKGIADNKTASTRPISKGLFMIVLLPISLDSQ
jgi:hypothetical protein